MAKFGIALGSGPRGLGFESRYSDQKRRLPAWAVFFFLLVSVGIRKAVKKTCQRHVFSNNRSGYAASTAHQFEKVPKAVVASGTDKVG